MGSTERRTRARHETRQRILDAARELFVRDGYEATTMRGIAERIEYTPTAIYHHFPSKEALLTELCLQDFGALASAFQRIGKIDDPVERLIRSGAAYVEFALTHPMQYQLMFMTRRPPLPELQKGHGSPSEDAYAFLRECCRAAVASGQLRPELRDPDELAQIAWSSLHGLMSLYVVHQDGSVEWRDPRGTAARMCDALVRGMLRNPN
jgi:AcrR family transcriptional regulator